MADTEHAVHARFQHPGIVRLVGFSRGETPTGERGRRCLVYELLHGGSVDAVLRDAARAAHFTWKLRVRAACSIAVALNYLHRGGSGAGKCFHRDIKSANVCLTSTLSAKLIDCGIAKLVKDEDRQAGQTSFTTGIAVGTQGYTCPVYMNGRPPKYNEKADVYSFGIFLLELLSGRLQSDEDPLEALLEGAADEGRRGDARAGDWPDAVVRELFELADACIRTEVSGRARLTYSCDRRIGMSAALQQLRLLVREHCQPTVVEAQLEDARRVQEEFQRNQELREASVAAAAQLAAADQRQCLICMDDFPSSAGVACSLGHFLCDDCFSNQVMSCAGDSREDIERREAKVECRALGTAEATRCRAAFFEDQVVALHVPHSVFARHISNLERLARWRGEAQGRQGAFLEQEHRAREQRNRQRNAQVNADARVAAQGLVRCPSCRADWYRDGGCDHITCPTCHFEFCHTCGVESVETVCPGRGRPHRMW